MTAALALAALLGAGPRLLPPLQLSLALPEPPAAAIEPRPPRKSPGLALGLTLASELATFGLGPSAGHAYAGEWEHLAVTGGGRVADLALLTVLEKFVPGFGIGPLYALTHPEHLGASFSAYPLAFPVDLVLVVALFGSAVYDIVDSWFAAGRANAATAAPLAGSLPAPAAAALPPK